MAEEDLIFGKNRHLFGGIEPSNMIQFRYVEKDIEGSSSKNMELILTLPKDTVVDGQTLCTVAGVVIRKKTGSHPTDEFDGELVQDIKASGGTSHTVSLGTKPSSSPFVYYSAFPYTTQGVYNRNKANRCINNSNSGKYLFGFDLDLMDDDPATRVTYPSDVDNYAYSPAGMIKRYNGTGNSNEYEFSYGDWCRAYPITANVIQAYIPFMPRLCVLASNGTVLEYTISANRVKLTDNGTNLMLEWPKIYTHREIDGTHYKFRCSNIKINDDWDCWCNYDANGNEIDHFYTGAYLGKKDSDGRLRSVSGETPDYFTTEEAMLSAVRANGSSIWTTDVLVDRLLIQDLLILLSKSTNGGKNFGYGSNNDTDKTGLTDSTEDTYFGTSSKTGLSGVVKVFGMEDLWSPRYRYLSGLSYGKGLMKIKTNVKKGDIDDTISLTFNQTEKGYIKSSKVRPYGRLPGSDLGGSSTTYDCDALSYDGSHERSAYAGTGIGDEPGPFAVKFANATKIYASLSCKPLAKKGGNE